MSKKNMVWEIVKKELRDVARDKKTLLTMVIVPLIFYPLLIVFMIFLYDSMGDPEITSYNKIGFAFEPDASFNTIIQEMEIDRIQGTEKELKTKLENGNIQAYIVLKDNIFTIYADSKDTMSQQAGYLADSAIQEYKKVMQSYELTKEGLLPEEILDNFTVEYEDISEMGYAGSFILSYMPAILFMVATMTACFAAIDMTAGEKERGTLETLLTFPLKTSDIIFGKFLATAISAMVSSIVGFASMYGIIIYFAGKKEILAGIQMMPIINFVYVLILIIIYSLLVSALAIALSSNKKSFKESQSSTTVLNALPMIAMFLPMIGIEFNIKFACIPGVNVCYLLNDVMKNSINFSYFIVTVISNLIFMYVGLKIVSKIYKSDKVLFS